MSLATSTLRRFFGAVVSSCEVVAAAAHVSARVEAGRAPASEDLARLGLPESAFEHLRTRA